MNNIFKWFFFLVWTSVWNCVSEECFPSDKFVECFQVTLLCELHFASVNEDSFFQMTDSFCFMSVRFRAQCCLSRTTVFERHVSRTAFVVVFLGWRCDANRQNKCTLCSHSSFESNMVSCLHNSVAVFVCLCQNIQLVIFLFAKQLCCRPILYFTTLY